MAAFLTSYIASPEHSVDKDLNAVSGIKRKKCPDELTMCETVRMGGRGRSGSGCNWCILTVCSSFCQSMHALLIGKSIF